MAKRESSISLVPAADRTLGRSKKVKNYYGQTTKSLEKGSICFDCSLRGSSFVPPEDVGDPQFLVVGEAPGHTEAEKGRPFVGKTGRPLRKVLKSLGVGYRVLNTVQCLPAGEDRKLRPPTPREVDKCQSIFLNQSTQCFDVVVLVGSVALNAIFGSLTKKEKKKKRGESITALHGSVLLKDGVRYIPVYHPSYILRQVGDLSDPLSHPSRLVKDWVSDIYRVPEILKGLELPFRVRELTYEKDIDEAVRDLRAQEVVVIDVETSGLDTRRCEVYSASLCGLEGDVYVVANLSLLRRVLDLVKPSRVLCHNAKFDYSVLMAKGIDLSGSLVYDTMLMAGVVDANRHYGGFSLKELARRYIGYRYSAMIRDLDNIGSYPRSAILKYNAEDAYATRELFKFFRDVLFTEEQMEFVEKVQSGGVKVISEMEHTGLLLDGAAVREELESCKRVISEAAERIRAGFGNGSMDVSSPQQLAAEIEKTLGDHPILQLHRTGKTDQLSTAKDHLKQMVEFFDKEYETYEDESYRDFANILRDILEYRAKEKLRGSFLEAFLEKLQEDSRIYPSYNMIGTRTGRLSSEEPNAQQIPRPLRRVFVPRPGFVFIEADKSQVEIRVAGIIADEPTIKKAYREGMDVHSLTASGLSGVPYERLLSGAPDRHPEAGELRQRAKAGNFGLLYGMEAEGYKEYARNNYGVVLSLEQATEDRAAWFSRYRGFEIWHFEVGEKISEVPKVVSPMGREYVFDPPQNDYELGEVTRKALNYPVQGTASDLNLYTMGKLFDWKVKEGKEVYFCGTVHDSVLLEVREDLAEEVADKIREIASGIQDEFSWVTIPIVDDVNVKSHW